MRDLHDELLTTDGKHYKQIAGTSSESKPTENLVTGSMFIEVDTAKLYFFNEADSGSWGDGIQLGSGS
jgi:hypothetical protein